MNKTSTDKKEAPKENTVKDTEKVINGVLRKLQKEK